MHSTGPRIPRCRVHSTGPVSPDRPTNPRRRAHRLIVWRHWSIVPASRSTNHRDEGSESQGHELKTGRARTDVRPPTLRKTPSGSMTRASGSRRGLPEDHARTFDGAWTRPATPSVAPASRTHSPSRPMSSHWLSPTSSGTSRGSPSICSICTSESSGDSTTAVGAVETWLTPSGNRM